MKQDQASSALQAVAAISVVGVGVLALASFTPPRVHTPLDGPAFKGLRMALPERSIATVLGTLNYVNELSKEHTINQDPFGTGTTVFDVTQWYILNLDSERIPISFAFEKSKEAHPKPYSPDVQYQIEGVLFKNEDHSWGFKPLGTASPVKK